MGTPAENEIVEAIASILYATRDETWAEMAVEIAFAGGFSQFRTWSRTSYDGEWQPTPRYADQSAELAGLFADLRRLMFRAGAGTWFSARLTVAAQGDFRSDYDFDGEPHFDPPAPPGAFAEDLREFPRDPSRVPEWAAEGA